MLTAVRTAIFAALLAAFSFRQEAPDPFLLERVLPPEPLFYLSVPQSPRVSEGYRASHLRRLIENEEVKAFVEPLEAWWKKRRTDPGPRGAPSIVLLGQFPPVPPLFLRFRFSAPTLKGAGVIILNDINMVYIYYIIRPNVDHNCRLTYANH